MSLKRFADDIWFIDGGTIPYWAPPIPVSFTYAQRSVVIRLRDGSLIINSPVKWRPDLKPKVDALGRVAHLVTPNKLHHLNVSDWVRAYPAAGLHAPPGLSRKRPDLRIDSVLGDVAPASWAGEIDQMVFRGSFFMDEVVFFHRATRTLVLGDLIENHEPSVLSSSAQRFWARRNAMLAPDGSTPKNFRLSFLRRDLARACLRRMLDWEPERVIVLHGRCAEQDASGFLNRAFGWLGP
jgi:hypothetical protein